MRKSIDINFIIYLFVLFSNKVNNIQGISIQNFLKRVPTNISILCKKKKKMR